MITALRGMKDMLPARAKLYAQIIKTCEEVAKNYGYEQILTPHLEETALFKRSVGESSDIVGKEMYQFEDKGGNDVCSHLHRRCPRQSTHSQTGETLLNDLFAGARSETSSRDKSSVL